VTFAKRLKALGLKQIEFAKILSELSGKEILTAQVNQWAKGKRNPSAGLLAFIALLEREPKVLERLRASRKQ
jgi:transcriptional regulator with XRE-family HTH domain